MENSVMAIPLGRFLDLPSERIDAVKDCSVMLSNFSIDAKGSIHVFEGFEISRKTTLGDLQRRVCKDDPDIPKAFIAIPKGIVDFVFS